MGRATFTLCVVLLGFSCISGMSGESARSLVSEGDTITVFITGDELGALKPCGCSGGQLGGLDRRAAILDTVAGDKRLILDTGNFVAGESEQDPIKFYIVAQAYGMLGYDVVRFTEKDIEVARNLGMLQATGSAFSVISASDTPDANLPSRYTKRFITKDGMMAINVGAMDTKADSVSKIGSFFDKSVDGCSVNILIVNDCNQSVLERVKKTGSVDCLICPSEGDEPIRNSKAGEKPVVISVGRLGKYVGVLQVKESKGKEKRILEFEVKNVSEDLPQQEAQVKLYRDYQQMVKDAGLLEQYPRFALSDGLKYVGSDSCNTACHKDVYAIWSEKRHAHAYSTLEKVRSQYDPECVVCHVVGMKDESGFVNEDGPEDLRNVGCENCHGLGSEHVKNPMGVATPGDSWGSCVTCHTTEHSAGFAGHEKEYLEKIRHWPEQKEDSNVKK